MSTIKIEINTDNAAFADGNYDYEVKRILGKVSSKIEYGFNEGEEFVLFDINGNKVGKVVVE